MNLNIHSFVNGEISLSKIKVTGESSCMLESFVHELAGSGLLRIQDVEEYALNSKRGVYIFKLEDENDDNSLRLIYGNEASENITNLKCDGRVGKFVKDFEHFSNFKFFQVEFVSLIRNAESGILKGIFTQPKKPAISFFMHAVYLGKQSLAVFFDNPTEEIQHNSEKSNNEELSNIIQAAPLPTFIIHKKEDTLADIIAVSNSYNEMFGDKCINTGHINDWLKCYIPEIEVRHQVKQHLLNKELSRGFSVKLSLQSAEILEVILSSIVLDNFVMVTITDVLANKRAEQKVLEVKELMELMYNSSPDGILLADMVSVKALIVNKSFEKITGYTFAEVEDLSSFMGRIFLEEDKDIVLSHIQKKNNAKYKEIIETKIRLKTKSGDIRWVQVREQIVKQDANKNPLQMLTCLTDITEQKYVDDELQLKNEEIAAQNEEYLALNEELKEVNERLARQKEYLDSIFRASPVGIGMLINREFTYINSFLETITGYTADELIGKDAHILYPSTEEYERVGKLKYAQIDREGIGVIETKWQRKNGEIIDVLLSSSPIDINDLSKGVTFSALDITKRLLTEKKLADSEDLFRTSFQTTPDAIFISKLSDGTLIEVNDGFVDMSGYSAEEAIGKQILELGLWRNLEQRLKFLELIENQGYVHNFLVDSKSKNGDKLILEVSSNCFMRNGDRHVLSIAKDMTERIRMEEGLKTSEERLSMALMGGNLGLWDWDIIENIITVNDRWLEMIGYSPSELEVTVDVWKSLLHPDDVDFAEIVLQSHLRGETAFYEVEFRMKTKYNKWKWVLARGKVMSYSSDRQPSRMVGTHLDISDNKSIIEQLNKSKLKAEESDRLKSAFLANMSHEIRTPMNGIVGFSELLEDETLTIEKRRRYIQVIQKRSGDLLNIINDILDISKIEAGQLEVKKEMVNVKQMMDDILMMYQEKKIRENKHNVDLILTMDPVICKKGIYSDESRLRQVISNMIDNAFKFTEIGSIEFGYKNFNNDCVEFFVKDTGIGIPKEKQGKVFDRFIQHDSSDTHQYGGNGLGLAICKGLITLLGGDVRVESKEGEGARFYFTIPCNRTAIETPKVMPENRPVVKRTWEEHKLLIIEDDETSSVFLQEILEPTGAELYFAKTGAEARQIFNQNEEFSLILMDINLSDSNGIELTKEFRSKGFTNPIIAQTAYAMQNDKEKTIAAGCNDYLSKPINISKLFRVIRKHLFNDISY